MARRYKAGRGDKRRFSRTAMRTKRINFVSGPMRGGIRL